MEDLVIKIRAAEIPRFIKTGEVSDKQINDIIKHSDEFYRVFATLDITYRMPDHLDLVQTFLYKIFDLSPEFPKSRKYLDFWNKKIKGPLHSVRIYSARYQPERQIRHAIFSETLH